MPVSRRSFLKGAAAVTAASAASGALQTVLGETSAVTTSSTGPNKWRGRVAINFNKDAVSSDGTTANAETITAMFSDSIKLLTGESTPAAAWKAIFPSTLSATSKIAIKTNFYVKTICPPPVAILTIVKGLASMDFNGSPYTGEITVYEGTVSPNKFTAAGYDAKQFSDAHPKGIVKLEQVACETATDPADGESQCAPALNRSDFLINVFSARGHDTFAESVSLGFKSHYGTYPVGSHAAPGFSQRVRNLHCTGAISKKEVLSVSCAFFCNNEGEGMGATNIMPFTNYVKTIDANATCKSPSTLILSTDPISCEMQVIKLLRLNKNKPYGIADMPKYLRASAGVTGALSDKTYDIGEIDEAKMDIRKIINGVITTTANKQSGVKASSSSSYSLKITALHSQGTTHFEFKLPVSLQGSTAGLEIHDLHGRLLFSKEIAIYGTLNHFSWNHKSSNGASLGSGKYVATLKAGRFICSDAFIL